MPDGIEVRDVVSPEKCGDRSGQRAGSGKKDADAAALRICQKIQNQRDNDSGLFRCFPAEKKMDGLGRFLGEKLELRPGRRFSCERSGRIDWTRRAECLLPGADPALVKIAGLVSRIA